MMNRTIRFAVIKKTIVIFFLLVGTTAFCIEKEMSGPDDKGVKEAAPEISQITIKVAVSSARFASVPVAVVNDDEITLADLNDALSSSHEARVVGKTQSAKIDYPKMLQRLINVKLIIQEAKTMGIDELAEVKEAVNNYSRDTLRDLLIDEFKKDAKLDEAAVENLYKEIVRQWKIRSVMFKKEDDAKKMEEEIKAGKNFDELAAKAIDDKTGEGSKEAVYFKAENLQPQVVDAVSKMEVGSVSTIIKVPLMRRQEGYVILKLEDIRYPDDPEVRARAKDTVFAFDQVEAVKKHKRELIDKYAVLNEKMIKKLDYESEKPGLKKLSEDKRVLASIKNEDPVTVADLTQAIKEMFFHGIDRAIAEKKVNKKKLIALDGILERRLFRKETLLRGIDKSDKYKRMVKDFENSLLFNAVVQKAIAPDVKVSDEEMKAYYDEHKSDFTYPEMMKIKALVFGKIGDAEAALDKLQKGAEFQWVKANAEGQVDKKTQGLLTFEDEVVMKPTLPPALQNVLSGVRSEEFRLYKSREGHFYVFYVQDVIPSREQPFDEAKETISNIISSRKLNEAMEKYVARLKEQAEIHVYLADTNK